MTPQENRGAEGDAARVRFLKHYRVGQWIVFALVALGSVWGQPALATDLLFLGLASAFVIGVIVVGRTPLVAGPERQRLLLEQLVAVILLAAMIAWAGPQARAPMFALALPVALAPLLIGVRLARLVLGVALLGVLGIAAAAWQAVGRPALVDALVAGALFGLVHVLSAQLVQLFAAVRKRMLVLAERDSLTGAYALTTFLTLGASAHEQAVATRRPYAVLVIDVDDLKGINARFGHTAGSNAIRLVATALERLREPGEIMSRYDGDKFALLLPQLEGTRATELAQRIRNVVFATTLNVDTHVVRIKANVGVAKYPVDGTTLDALLLHADADMRVDRAGREPPKAKPVFKRRPGAKSGTDPGV